MLSIITYKEGYESVDIFQYQDLIIGPKVMPQTLDNNRIYDKICIGIWEVNLRYFSNLSLEKRHTFLRIYEYVKFSLDKVYNDEKHEPMFYKQTLKRISQKIIEYFNEMDILDSLQKCNIFYERKELNTYQLLYCISIILSPIIYYMDLIHNKYKNYKAYDLINAALFYDYMLFGILSRLFPEYMETLNGLVEDIFPTSLINKTSISDPGKKYYAKYRTMAIRSLSIYHDINDKEDKFFENCLYIGDIASSMIHQYNT
jgi:hypothetical protein